MSGQEEVVLASAADLVARNLRVAQAAAKVSNTDLAAAVNVSPRTVGKWRRAEVEITLSSLEKVASALGRDVRWFLSDHLEAAA